MADRFVPSSGRGRGCAHGERAQAKGRFAINLPPPSPLCSGSPLSLSLPRRTKKHKNWRLREKDRKRRAKKELTVSFPWQELIGLEVGGKLHVGRSRNDQVATDMRLWLRSAILQLKTLMASLISRITSRAEA